MLLKLNKRADIARRLKLPAVTFVELVVHPGGPDGGEFPQEHTYGIGDGVYYTTGQPICPNDTFCEEPDARFIESNTAKRALKLLKERLKAIQEETVNLEKVIAALEENPKKYRVIFQDGDDEDDEDGLDDDDDEE